MDPGWTSTEPIPWQPDRDAKVCPICMDKFDIINRRHHCRVCGRVVCDRCSPLKRIIPSYPQPVRTCLPCDTKKINDRKKLKEDEERKKCQEIENNFIRDQALFRASQLRKAFESLPPCPDETNRLNPETKVWEMQVFQKVFEYVGDVRKSPNEVGVVWNEYKDKGKTLRVLLQGFEDTHNRIYDAVRARVDD